MGIKHSIEEIEEEILQSYTGYPNLESTFPIGIVKEGAITIEGVTYNYRTVRKDLINPNNNSHFYFSIDL